MRHPKFIFRLVVYLFILLFLVSCSVQQKDEEGCTRPPDSFSSTDLVGTWYAGRPDRNDTLIIREDGLYKQIVHVEFENFDYESDWQSWWLENNDDGIPYLHLDGMRMCVYFSAKDCDSSGSDETNWYDFCRDEVIQTPGEGVLMVLGIPERFVQPPRGIDLIAFKGHTIGVTKYDLQEP